MTLTWVDGERWVQVEDVQLSGPTGRRGTQATWQIGQRDGAFSEFIDEGLVDDSYLVGDSAKTFEQALNVVSEPTTDILFELTEAGSDRLLRLIAKETQNNRPVTVEVRVNDATAGYVTFHNGEEATLEISRLLLRAGWNHIALRHANVIGDGEYVIWDALMLEEQSASSTFQALVKNRSDGQLASTIQFGETAADGAVVLAPQYVEIHYEAVAPFDRITISTDNRDAPIHRFTGPTAASASGLVGEIDSARTVPLLWQVYDEVQAQAPTFDEITQRKEEIEQWAFVPDQSESKFDTPEARDFRTVVSRSGLGDRPAAGRPATSPIVLYLVADFRDKPAQPYTVDRLIVERIEQ